MTSNPAPSRPPSLPVGTLVPSLCLEPFEPLPTGIEVTTSDERPAPPLHEEVLEALQGATGSATFDPSENTYFLDAHFSTEEAMEEARTRLEALDETMATVLDYGADWEEHPLSATGGRGFLTTGRTEWWIQAVVHGHGCESEWTGDGHGAFCRFCGVTLA